METIDIQIKSNAPEVAKETTSLREQVKELRKEMESCAVGSDEYNAALVKLAQTTHDLREQQEAVKNSAGDLGTVLNNIQQVGTGIAAGFSSVNAIMALTGSNSEALQKTMVKLQAGIALVQGMKGMEGMGKKIKATITSIKSMITTTKTQTAANQGLAASEGTVTVATKATSAAMKGLKAALISTGIGAIIVLVGTLASHLEDLVSWLGFGKEETVDFDAANEALDATLTKLDQEYEVKLAQMKAEGASYEELYEAELQHLKNQIAIIEVTRDMAQAEADLVKQRREGRRWRDKDQEEWKKATDEAEAQQKKIDALNVSIQKLYWNRVQHNREEHEANARAAASATQKIQQELKKGFDEYYKALEKAEDEAKKAFAGITTEYSKMQKTMNTMGDIFGNAGKIEGLSQALLSSSLDALTTKKNEAVAQWEETIEIIRTRSAPLLERIAEIRQALNGAKGQQKLELEAELESLSNRAGEMSKAIDAAEMNIEQIIKAYTNAANALINSQSTLNDTFDELEANLGDDSVLDDFYEMKEAAQQLSKTFTEQYKVLEYGLQEGILSSEDYYKGLETIMENYSTGVKSLEDGIIKQLEEARAAAEGQTELQALYTARIEELRRYYSEEAVKIQKQAGNQLLDLLDKQIDTINAEADKAIEAVYTKLSKFEGNYITWWQKISTPIWSYFKLQREAIDEEEAAENTRHTNVLNRLNEELNKETLTAEQKAQINLQIEEEEARHTAVMGELTAKRNKQKQTELEYALEVASQSFSAMEGLFNGLNNLSKARMEVLDQQLAEEKISQKEYDKLKKEEIEKQAAMQTGAAIMQTAAGITTAWATAMQLGFPAGPIIAGIQTAAFIVNLVAQLKSIDNAKNAALSGNSSGASGAASTPDTSFTLTSVDAYQNTLSDETQSDLQANAQNNQRVYVVSSDISDAQNNEKTTVTTATF